MASATWDTVVAAPEFNALPIEQKAEVRNAFFNREIAPKAPAEHLDQVRSAFLARTDESLKRTAAGAGAVKPAPEAIQDSGDMTKGFWYEQAAKGLAQTPEFAGMAADAMLTPLEKIINVVRAGLGKPNIKGSAIAPDFRKALRDTGIVKDIPPTTEAQRIGGKPAEFIAGSLPFSVANVASATGRRGVVALQELLSNVGGAEGATLGGAAGKELTGGPVGEGGGALVGGLVGGGVSAMAVPMIGKSGIDWVKNKFSELRQAASKTGKALTQEQLDKILGPQLAQILAADPGAAARLKEASGVAAKVPGLNFDLASATGSNVIGAMKGRVSQESPDILSQFTRLSENNEKVLKDFRAKMFPEGGAKPQDLARSKVTGDAADLEKNAVLVQVTLDRQLAETEKTLADLAAVHAKPEKAAEIGEQLVKLRDQAAEIRIAQAQAQYGPVYQLADQMGWRADVAPLVQSVRGAMRSGAYELKSDQTPQVFRDILKFADRKRLDDTRDAVEQAARKAGGKLPTSISQYVARYGGMSRAEVGGNLDGIADAKNPRDYGKLPPGLSEGESRRLISNGETAKSPSNVLLELKAKGYLPEDADLNDMYEAIRYEVQRGRPTTFAAIDQNKAYEQQMLAAQERFTEEKGAKAVAAKADGAIEIPFREFHDLQRRINRDLQRPGRATENLMDLKDQVKGILRPFEGDGALGDELKKANEFWATQWKEPFIKGAGASMKKAAPENVVERSFLRRGELGASDWKRIYGDSKEAARLLYEGTADSFVQAAIPKADGKLNLSSAQGWLNKNDRFLKAFPDLRMEFETVIRGTKSATEEGAAKAGTLESKLKSIDQAKTELERGALAKIADVEDVPALARAAIGSPKEMDAILRLVRPDPRAKQGFAKALSDVIIDSANPEAVLLSHQDSLKKAFNDLGPGHWDNLQAIVKGEQILARGGDPNRVRQVEGEIDPLQKAIGTSSSSLFSLAKAVQYGYGGSAPYAIFHVGGRYLFKVQADQKREFLVKVLTNPEVAEKLAETYKNVTPADVEKMAMGFYNESATKARAQYQKIKDELEPILRLHGIRVTVNAANTAGRQEGEQEAARKADAGTKGAVQAQGQRRLRELQGMGAGR